MYGKAALGSRLIAVSDHDEAEKRVIGISEVFEIQHKIRGVFRGSPERLSRRIEIAFCPRARKTECVKDLAFENLQAGRFQINVRWAMYNPVRHTRNNVKRKQSNQRFQVSEVAAPKARFFLYAPKPLKSTAAQDCRRPFDRARDEIDGRPAIPHYGARKVSLIP